MFGCKNEDSSFLLQHGRKTVIIYMIAENTLSSYSQKDIDEMISCSSKIPSDCNLLIYIDKGYNAIDDTLPKLVYIANGKTITIKTYPEQNSCEGAVFASVLSDIKTLSSSDSYSLVMWSHGTGWLPSLNTPSKSIGIDNNKNAYSNIGSEMNISTMYEVLEQSGLHFEWILFDACFMQCIEVAYELKNLTDYIIGSPAEIPAKGAPYDVILPDFFLTDKENSAYSIATNYFYYYNNSKGVLLSVVKTSELENLATMTSQCLGAIPNVNNADNIQAYAPWSKKSSWRPEYYDIASIMFHNVNLAQYEEWFKQLELTVPIRLHTKEWTSIYNFDATLTDSFHYAGISMFLPAERYKEYGYNETIKNTSWWKKVFCK